MIKLQARATGPGRGIVEVYDDIGEGGITPALVADTLRALGAIREVEVRINSLGGSPFDGVAIYNQLRRHGARVHVVVDGVAASAASIIAMAGDDIAMARGSWLMIHNPAGGALGDAETMEKMRDLLDRVAAEMATIYSARTGKPVDDIRPLMDAETWMNADDAVEHGFADRALDDLRVAAHVPAGRFMNAPRALLPSDTPAAPATPAPSVAARPTPATPPPPRSPAPQTAAVNSARAAAILDLCAEAGAMDMAVELIRAGVTVEEARTRIEGTAHSDTDTMRARAAAIAEMCMEAGENALAVKLIEARASVAHTKARLETAASIRAQFEYARRINPSIDAGMADRYITAGTSEHVVRQDLLRALHELQSPEILNAHSAHSGDGGSWSAIAKQAYQRGADAVNSRRNS